MQTRKIRPFIFVSIGLFTIYSIFSLVKALPSVAAIKENQLFEDWKTGSEKLDSQTKATFFIEQHVTKNEEGKSNSLATYRFYYNKENKKFKFLTILPLGVLLQPGAALIANEANIDIAKFNICNSAGCFAAMELENKDIDTLINSNKSMVAMFTPEGKQLNLPFSIKGLKEALDSLK